jgi:hypothetical protein
MSITAKVLCGNKTTFTPDGTGMAAFSFYPDYANGRNKEWAASTPTLELKITVKDGGMFEVGKSYTLTFDEDVPAPTVVAAPTTEAAAAPTAAPTT